MGPDQVLLQKRDQGSSVEQQWERRNLPRATLFPPTHTQTPGPSGISAGFSRLTGVEPAQLAEAGQPEFEQCLLLRLQCVRHHA